VQSALFNFLEPKPNVSSKSPQGWWRGWRKSCPSLNTGKGKEKEFRYSCILIANFKSVFQQVTFWCSCGDLVPKWLFYCVSKKSVTCYKYKCVINDLCQWLNFYFLSSPTELWYYHHIWKRHWYCFGRVHSEFELRASSVWTIHWGPEPSVCTVDWMCELMLLCSPKNY
jgi:hypothetical protein